MQFQRRSRRPPSINIVSLIDILTLLLIFFTVTTTFRVDQPAVEIKLPDSKTAAPVEQDLRPVLVSVSADNQVFVGEDAVPMEQLPAKLRAMKAARPDAPFALRSDEKADFGPILKVLDAFKEAGIENVPAFTQPPEP